MSNEVKSQSTGLGVERREIPLCGETPTPIQSCLAADRSGKSRNAGEKIFVISILSFFLFICFQSCRENPIDNIPSEIPADPSVPAPAVFKNNLVPSGSFLTVDGERRKFNMTGVVINEYSVDLKGTNESAQNLWLEIDSVHKGILVKKVSTSNKLTADVVFCVDVSGSMNDAITDSIINTISSFDDYLYSYGVDLRFGGIGFVGDIRGVKHFTNDVANFKNWVSSTRFEDPTTEIRFPAYGSSSLSQNSVTAIKYADSAFAWRGGAQRIFIVFTDAPTSPSSKIDWANQWVASNLKGKASVHVIFSGDTTAYSSLWDPPNLSNQNPKDLATSTGGTYKIIPADGQGLHLRTLPVATALASSHSVEFLTSAGSKNVRVVLTVSSNNDGESKLLVNFP